MTAYRIETPNLANDTLYIKERSGASGAERWRMVAEWLPNCRYSVAGWRMKVVSKVLGLGIFVSRRVLIFAGLVLTGGAANEQRPN